MPPCAKPFPMFDTVLIAFISPSACSAIFWLPAASKSAESFAAIFPISSAASAVDVPNRFKRTSRGLRFSPFSAFLNTSLIASASSPNGDYNRLFNAVTVRAYQELGVSNFVVASHTYNVRGSVSHSKDWFTPLLTDESGVVTDKISDLKLKKGDEIFITENSTGWKYTFRVSKISFGEKGNSENIVYKDVNYDKLSAHIGEPMITLQGCSGENDLLFVRGTLEKIEDPQSGETYRP